MYDIYKYIIMYKLHKKQVLIFSLNFETRLEKKK